jgi:hypothetical protein
MNNEEWKKMRIYLNQKTSSLLISYAEKKGLLGVSMTHALNCLVAETMNINFPDGRGKYDNNNRNKNEILLK